MNLVNIHRIGAVCSGAEPGNTARYLIMLAYRSAIRIDPID
jgi:hypothetical protein